MSPMLSGVVTQISGAVSRSVTSGAVTQISGAVSRSATSWQFHITVSSAVSWSATMWHFHIFHILCLLAVAVMCAKRPMSSAVTWSATMWPADSGAEGPYDMSTKKEKMFGRPRLATGVSSSGGVHRGGRWIASVINDIRQWQLSINNSWTTSHHEDRLRDTRHSHSRRDNLQRIVCQGSSDDGRPLEFFQVCDAPTENRPRPICKIPICDCRRLRGALCMCGESCELPKN